MRVVTTLRWGQAAPEFELPSTEGRPISLRELRGHDVVTEAEFDPIVDPKKMVNPYVATAA